MWSSIETSFLSSSMSLSTFAPFFFFAPCSDVGVGSYLSLPAPLPMVRGGGVQTTRQATRSGAQRGPAGAERRQRPAATTVLLQRLLAFSPRCPLVVVVRLPPAPLLQPQLQNSAGFPPDKEPRLHRPAPLAAPPLAGGEPPGTGAGFGWEPCPQTRP